MGARWNAGFVGRQAWRPQADRARFCRWPEQGTEAERLLTLTDHLKLPRDGLQLDFPLQAADRSAARTGKWCRWSASIPSQPRITVAPSC